MDRRTFLKAGCYGATVFTGGGLIMALPHRAFSADLIFTVSAEATIKTLVNGASAGVWQFTSNGSSPG
ncbi:MAG: hypothetical protein OEY67_10905, partial [Gammaproteobacteria bacterium]|nr:hypothetical protein [Gammaproteobacteria bacterium]